MRVLGTAIEDGGSHAAAVLISDLHVAAGGGAVVDGLHVALAVARERRASLFVLGDLFDSYVSRHQVRTGVWRDVATAFAAATAAGVPITLLHGNRDFLMRSEFAAASGARVVGGGLRVRLGGIDTLLLHGDELCQNDLPYQRAKRWLRSPVLGFVARQLPLRLALHLAERARQKSRTVIATGDQQRFLPTAAALDAAFATGVVRLVFGHIHRFRHGIHRDAERGPEYWVLPAFDEAATGLVVGGDGVSAVRFVGPGARCEPVAPPAPLVLRPPGEVGRG